MKKVKELNLLNASFLQTNGASYIIQFLSCTYISQISRLFLKLLKSISEIKTF